VELHAFAFLPTGAPFVIWVWWCQELSHTKVRCYDSDLKRRAHTRDSVFKYLQPNFNRRA